MIKIDFSKMAEAMPSGVVVADRSLRVHYMNPFAEKLLGHLSGSKPELDLLPSDLFYNTDNKVFDMTACMQQMITSGKRLFHKTLVLNNGYQERMVFLSSSSFGQKGKRYFLLVISDISDEMDCIVNTQGVYGRGSFYLSKKIIGNHEKIRNIHRMITLAAESNVNVMVCGESGTGKELVAEAIHELSDRSKKPLIKVNCSALSETLLESELFGHVKGAFTGAIKDKPGKFEEAQGGTIFLDEIGEISSAIQVKLLRVIQEKIIERVGENKPRRIDMRIIAATNKDLRELISKNSFREDLFYRLNVFSVMMPSLRERSLDIPLLAEHFIRKLVESTGKQIKGLDRDALRVMMEHNWPGNVREMQNALEHAFVLVQGNTIDIEDLPAAITKPAQQEPIDDEYQKPAETNDLSPLRKSRGNRLKISKQELMEVLGSHDWNQTQTAKSLGISRVALWKKMKKFEL